MSSGHPLRIAAASTHFDSIVSGIVCQLRLSGSRIGVSRWTFLRCPFGPSQRSETIGALSSQRRRSRTGCQEPCENW